MSAPDAATPPALPAPDFLITGLSSFVKSLLGLGQWKTDGKTEAAAFASQFDSDYGDGASPVQPLFWSLAHR